MSAQIPQPALDRHLALLRVGGDTELLHEIAVLFAQDCPRALAELRDAIERRDAKKVESAAHTIKGSVANFGARDAVDCAFCLEQMGRAGQLDQAADALSALEHALAVVCAELATL